MVKVPWFERLPVSVREPPVPAFTLMVPVLVRVPLVTVRLDWEVQLLVSMRRVPALVKPEAAVRVVWKEQLPWTQTVWPLATLPLMLVVLWKVKEAAPVAAAPRLRVERR